MNNTILRVPSMLFRLSFLLFALIPLTEGNESMNDMAWGLTVLVGLVSVLVYIVQAVRYKKKFLEVALLGRRRIAEYMDSCISIVGVAVAYVFTSPLLKVWIFFFCMDVVAILVQNLLDSRVAKKQK